MRLARGSTLNSIRKSLANPHSAFGNENETALYTSLGQCSTARLQRGKFQVLTEEISAGCLLSLDDRFKEFMSLIIAFETHYSEQTLNGQYRSNPSKRLQMLQWEQSLVRSSKI